MGGLISDDDFHVNNELVMHDQVYLDYGGADIDGVVNCDGFIWCSKYK